MNDDRWAPGRVAASFDEHFAVALADSPIRVIRVIHADLFGRQRAKQFPVSMWLSLAGGVAYSKMANAEDLLGVPVDTDQFPALAHHPDLHARIDPTTARIPSWEPDSLWVLGELEEQGVPSALCPRGQLRNASAQLATYLGLAAITAGEPEFYLFDQQGGAAYSQEGVSYTMDRVTDPTGMVGRIHRHLIDFGIGVTAANREFSPGQFEVNMLHDTVERAADAAFLLKTATKELARLEGYQANFMAKPRAGHEGSSLHVHLSLWRDGANVFDDAQHRDGLSDLARHSIAGLQRHAGALLAFAAPTVNSYKRLVGEGLSPRSSNWGLDDRLTFLRVPPERKAAARIELRAGDASASAHLLMAAMLHAVRDGITRELQPGAGDTLPTSLESAIDQLRGDEVLVSGFGEEFVEVYAALKNRESTAFRMHVTEWERDLYGPQV